MMQQLHNPIRRIAMLSVHTCPLAMLGGKKTGGMNVYVRDFARELGRRGIQVDVFTRSQDECVPMVMHTLGENARVVHIPAGPERPLPVPEIADYLDEFTQGVIAFAAQEGVAYDVIHSHYWLSGLVAGALRAAWGRRVPIVHMFHTLGQMKNMIASGPEERAPQSRIDGELEVIHAIADVIIAATPAEEGQLIDLYDAPPGKIVVIPPGVDLERFRPIPARKAKERIGLPPAKKNILLAGRIEPLKGIDTLLRAIALVERCCPGTLNDVVVTIVGGDPWADDLDTEMANLRALRDELALEHLVTFVGSKDQMILPNYYAASEMVVMPSHYESFGMVALEAMAMGTPVIASEVGGLAYLVEHNHTGFHVPSKDPAALADKINLLLRDDDLRRQFSQCAADVARQYAWPNIVDRMVATYQSLLQPVRPIMPLSRHSWRTACRIDTHMPASWAAA